MSNSMNLSNLDLINFSNIFKTQGDKAIGLKPAFLGLGSRIKSYFFHIIEKDDSNNIFLKIIKFELLN